MLNSRILLSTLTILMAATAVQSAKAERTSLFIDPSELEGDFQFFAPVDLSEYSGGQGPNTGFYFEYNRLYYSVSRPETAPIAGNREEADLTWGNRYDIGYMLDDGHGWLVSVVHIDGPTGPIVGNVNAMLNIGDLSGVELSKVRRLEPRHNGDNVELLYSVRYSKFTDNTNVHTENNMVGGQVGFRWSRRRGRWVISNETRLFAGHNFQHMGDDSFGEFVAAADLRFQAAFEITRDISLAVSFDVQHFGTGIARGNEAPVVTDENLTMYGVGFGAIYNR